VNPSFGLSNPKDFQTRIEYFGTNIIPSPKQKFWFKFFWNCFVSSSLLILLAIASIISFIHATVFPSEDARWTDFVESGAIVFEVLLVCGIDAQVNFIQKKDLQRWINKKIFSLFLFFEIKNKYN
jgi:magnesium-transporting ATPase (P-type)